MLVAILATGLATGAVYVLIAVTYNVMFSASRVMSFTAGQLGMLGGVFGSFLCLRLGLPPLLAFPLALLGGAVIGVVTELVAVRPVLASLDKHLYVLSTLAFALLLQQLVALGFSTEPQPFPVLMGLAEERFWLPVLACIVAVGGLEYLYRFTLLGHAFLAIAEDNFSARALGLPERRLRIASYAIAGAVGTLAGFAGGELMLASVANGSLWSFYGFVPVALGGLGNNRGAIVGGLLLGVFQQTANFLVGGLFVSIATFVVFIVVLLAAPQGLFGAAAVRRV